MSLDDVLLNSPFEKYYFDMMLAYELHHIPPHEFRKIGGMDWKIIKAIGQVTGTKKKMETQNKQAQAEMEAEIKARMRA
ncbi:MAG TPA: hypothetical protein DCL21_01640 [Alphaproteobacteria bacterium]|nr:hypothetical protein [Alphaproteobacteria bacterium]